MEPHPFNSPAPSRGPGSTTVPPSAERLRAYEAAGGLEVGPPRLPGVDVASDPRMSLMQRIELGEVKLGEGPSQPSILLFKDAFKPAIKEALEVNNNVTKELVEASISNFAEKLEDQSEMLAAINRKLTTAKEDYNALSHKLNWLERFDGRFDYVVKLIDGVKDKVQVVTDETGKLGQKIAEQALEINKQDRRINQLTGSLNAARKANNTLKEREQALRLAGVGRAAQRFPADPPPNIDRAEAISDSSDDEEGEDSEPEDSALVSAKRARPVPHPFQPPPQQGNLVARHAMLHAAGGGGGAAASSSSSSSSSSSYQPMPGFKEAQLAAQARKAADAMLAMPRTNHKYCTVCDYVFASTTEAVEHYASAAHGARAGPRV
jgi:hypothetical protein